MDWNPISRDQLDALVQEGLAEADDSVLEAWMAMRIEPEKWQCSPWGDEGGGFWVVAIHDGIVTYYNDIEEGFNRSPLVDKGVISEYWCNQNDFTQYLDSLKEAQEAENWAMGTVHGEIPQEISGPGRIIRRQTTYWTLLDESGRTWRVHFQGKAEMHFGSEAYESIVIADQHPLLDHHNEQWASLYFRGKPGDQVATLLAIQAQMNLITQGWRQYEHYGMRGAHLSDGFGLLMEGPTSIVRAIAAVLAQNGVKPSVIESLNVDKAQARLITFGSSYIVAQKFRFELIPAPRSH